MKWRFSIGSWVGLSLVLMLCALAADPAWAGPGGIIKAASQTLLGKIVFGFLLIIFSPLIVYYMIRTAIQVRKTRADLAELAKLHPQYRWLDMKDRFSAAFQWVWTSWSSKQMDKTADYCTHWYWQNQQGLLDHWAEQGIENVCRFEQINSITPLFVHHVEENDGEGSRVVVDIRARVVDYTIDKQTGNVVQGDKKSGDLETIWTFIWNNGVWRLNQIEESAQEWTYLFMPNEVPLPQGAAAANRA